MAINNRSAWTEKIVGYASNRVYVANCTVLAAVANWNAYTVKTPRGLDVKRPFTLQVYFSGDISGSGTPTLNIWGGYDDDFQVANTDGMTAASTATSGAGKIKILDNVATVISTLPLAVQVTPHSFNSGGAVADVVTIAAIATGPKVRVPCLPYYAFGVDGGAVLAAVTGNYKIIQANT
jgi:hypothetical protein